MVSRPDGRAATANVLLGNVNPGGKLPETFYDGSAPIGQRFPQDTQPAACADNTANYGTAPAVLGIATPSGRPRTPATARCTPASTSPASCGTAPRAPSQLPDDQLQRPGFLGGVQGNGIFQGYRWFDKNGYTPLFPFGHGLSYTNFEYRNLMVKPESDGTVHVNFIVRNKSNVAGAIVAQVYVGGGAQLCPAGRSHAARLREGGAGGREAKRIDLMLDRGRSSIGTRRRTPGPSSRPAHDLGGRIVPRPAIVRNCSAKGAVTSFPWARRTGEFRLPGPSGCIRSGNGSLHGEDLLPVSVNPSSHGA